MVFAGGPEQIADRILDLDQKLGHHRQILQADVDGLFHTDFLHSIELLSTEVLPPCPRGTRRPLERVTCAYGLDDASGLAPPRHGGRPSDRA